MDPVYASLLNAVGTLFLTETRGVGSQRSGQGICLDDRIDKLTDHGMLAGTDQVEVLSLNLIHHGIHLCKTHNACHHIASDHKRRYTVSESSVYHEIPGISDHCRMKSGDISHQIIKTVSCHFCSTLQINSIKGLHDICMVRNLIFRHYRLTETFHFHVLGVILADRNLGINDIRQGHHDLSNLLCKFRFLFLQLGKPLCILSYLFLNFLSLFLFSLLHQSPDLLRSFLAAGTKLVSFLLGSSSFGVKLDHFIHKGKLVILELVADILLYDLRILSYKF